MGLVFDNLIVFAEKFWTLSLAKSLQKGLTSWIYQEAVWIK